MNLAIRHTHRLGAAAGVLLSLVLPWTLLASGCARPEFTCPPGEVLNDDGNRCEGGVKCNGGSVVDDLCVCDEGTMLVDGECFRDPCQDVDCTSDDPCVDDGVCENGTCVPGEPRPEDALCGEERDLPCDGVDCDFPCTEQGIRDAIAVGGGPLTFDCEGRTVVTTASTIVIENDVILDGESNLVVDGNRDHRVFTVRDGFEVELRRLEVSGGMLTGSSSHGAGIHNSGVLLVSQSIVRGNETAANGGGIYNKNVLVLFDSDVKNNTAGDAGGGLYNASSAQATVESSSLEDNDAAHGGGAYSTGALDLFDTLVVGNTASELGAGLRNHGGVLNVELSKVYKNIAQNNGGGILSGHNDAELHITDSTVSSNVSVRHGGGIYTYREADIAGSTIAANTAVLGGGGIYNYETSLTITNCTITRNLTSDGEGGAIRATRSAFTNVRASTIWENDAPEGEAVFNDGNLRLNGSIIGREGAAGTSASTCAGDGLPNNSTYNIESPSNTCWSSIQNNNIPSVNSASLGFGDPSDNGGPTGTLRNTEPAKTIKGSSTSTYIDGTVFAPRPTNCFSDVDQRGEARPTGQFCDTGAVEQ